MEVNQIQGLQMVKKIENYIFYLTDKVGEGSFSQVYKGANINNNSIVAIKKVRIGDVKSKISRRLLECQVTILRELSHPKIIKCQDIHFSVNNCYIITDYCEGGNLELLFKRVKSLPEHQINKIILSVFRALLYLAHLGIVHRDVKLSNVFIQSGEYKLGDFGFAMKATTCFKDVSIGSPIYMSPEGLIHHIYGPKTDIWAFGILIYELLHGRTPLQSCRSEDELRKRVVEPPPFRSDISVQLRELVEGCLKVQEKERFTIFQVAESEYIRKLQQSFQAEQRLEKELTNTDFTSEKSESSKSQTATYLSAEVAISLLNYGHLVHKISRVSPSPIFQKCILWITRKVSTTYVRSHFREREIEAYEAIKKQSQKIINQYGFQGSLNFKVEQVLAQCEKMAQKQAKWSLQLKLLACESEYLMKAQAQGHLEQFAKKSKAKQHLATFPNIIHDFKFF